MSNKRIILYSNILLWLYPVLTKAAEDFSLFNLITEVKIAYDYAKSKPLKSCSVLF
jgi:hypothetical protein